MRCDATRPLLSAALDEALDPSEAAALEDHLDGCAACRAFERGVQALRRELRVEEVGDAPDVAPAVLAALPPVAGGRRAAGPLRSLDRGRVAVAAAFAVGVLAGAVLVGPGWRPPADVAAADLPARVLAAQADVRTLTARVDVVERGWHEEVGERRFTGTLAYRAPESLALRLDDRTDYPSAAWPPADTAVVVDGDRWWSQGPAGCPRELLPGCLSARPRIRSLTGREPFDEAVPAPLDLVVPVGSFAHAAAPAVLGTRRLEGRAAVGVAVPAAQVQPLLAAFTGAGAWRDVHPADRVELWLDADTLVPLAVEVLPGEDPERALWAARRGYRDHPGRPYLSIALTGVTVDGPVDDAAFPPAPSGAVARDAGFADGPTQLTPAWLPEGMAPHRSGWRRAGTGGPRVEVASWTDGRAWVAIRRVPGSRAASGASGARRVELPRAGTALVDRGGARVVLRSATATTVVTGSVGERALLRVADSLGVVALATPAPRLPDGLLVADGLEGFAPGEPRVDGGAVVVHHQGPGDRSVVVAQAPGDRLAPPLAGDVRGVLVRGAAGRYTPTLGLLEWVEDGWVVSLRSDTLALDELVATADGLVRR